MKKFGWKHVANVVKVLVALEMGIMFWCLPDRGAVDILVLCLGQYSVFTPVDASMLIKNIRGTA